jgi:uncharacterized protein (TIGR02598 family)
MRETKVEMNKFPRTRGFTLIEVTLALGVVSFALISLLGLIPAGLQTFRSSMDMSVRSQIVQRIAGDAMQTNFDTLIASESSDRYFDDQGRETTQQSYTYQVHVQVTPSTDLPAASSPEANSNLATVQILIVNNPAHQANPYSGNTNLAVFQTTALVARNERQ